MLDRSAFMMIIIIFTAVPCSDRGADADQRSQTRSSAATRHSEPTPRRSHGSTVCQRQFLRFPRSRPSQVRDASPSAERGRLGNRHRDRFRLLSALVLSGAVGFRRGWAGRLSAAQARPQAGTQADRRDLDLRPLHPPERALRVNHRTGALDPAAFRDQASSAKYRTPPEALSKKTSLSESGEQRTTKPDLTEQYEQLRYAATTGWAHEGERLGLALFLRRGITAWMQARSSRTDCVATNPPGQPAAAIVPIDLQTQIATLVAGMILDRQQEKATL